MPPVTLQLPAATPKRTAQGVTRRQHVLDALALPDPSHKCRATLALCLAFEPGGLAVLPDQTVIPGRLPLPALVPPRSLKKRSVNSPLGRAALIHSLAHIEINAVNLALDVVWRFEGLPLAFYQDWIVVAKEEAQHFGLLSAHLQGMGYAYGDFEAHDGLWDMAQRTSGDVLARLALVPRTLEARGLDASPAVRQKLADAGDHAGAEILDVILKDEIGHVAVGNRWYHWLCARLELDPLATYARLAAQHRAPTLRGPFNLHARRAAGFTEPELAALQLATLLPARP